MNKDITLKDKLKNRILFESKKLEPYLSDKLYLKIRFWLRVGYWPNLDNPRSFNEKLNWLKLHDIHPEYTKMVDKAMAKEYVSNIIGEEHIIPTIGMWDNAEEIDWQSLPNQFVLKNTGDSGGIVVCRDKSTLDIEAAIAKLKKGSDKNYYKHNKEYPYRDVKPRVIAEAYMEDESGELQDYKIHNFNGNPRFTLVCGNRFSERGLTEDFYSLDWQLMDVRRPNHPNADVRTPKPEELDELYRLANLLSKDIPFLRTDFYIVNHKIYFGELTFFPASGMGCFVPEEWDFKFGDFLKLPLCK